VSYDLGLRTDTYTTDDLKELCGCLIDVSVDSAPEDLASDEEHDSASHAYTELFVSLAHYTVREFLESTLILETKAAFFSLPLTTTTFEFTQSVLRQALCSDPTSLATDWAVDSEAYCLTLACALHCTALSARPDIQNLFLEYYNPNKPHYHRILTIQRRLLESFDHSSQHYLLQYLPTRVLLLSTMDKAPDCITTVLNIRLVCGEFFGADDLIARCVSVYAVENKRHLFETILVVTFCLLKDGFGDVPRAVSASSEVWHEVTYQGTIDDIFKHVHSGSSQFLGLTHLKFMTSDSTEASSSDTMSDSGHSSTYPE
jgi:hypothetical protein